jgi:hypothetical protein
MSRLDDCKFRPALVIPERKITGNTLKADPDHPTRGSAGVWQAELRVIATGRARPCWLLRRIGSEITSQIELVAQEHLRSCLNLCDGTAVRVTVWETESEWKPPTPEETMADWCQAARGVKENFGCEKALGYLIGEKFLRFLEVAEADGAWRRAIPAFAAEIRSMFEPGRLAEFLNTPRRLGALGHASSEEGHRTLSASMEESERIREDARNLMLLEWAKELLLESDG